MRQTDCPGMIVRRGDGTSFRQLMMPFCSECVAQVLVLKDVLPVHPVGKLFNKRFAEGLIPRHQIPVHRIFVVLDILFAVNVILRVDVPEIGRFNGRIVFVHFPFPFVDLRRWCGFRRSLACNTIHVERPAVKRIPEKDAEVEADRQKRKEQQVRGGEINSYVER